MAFYNLKMAVTEKEIKILEDYFKQANLPANVNLDVGSKIENVPKFIASHLSVLRNNGASGIYEVFYTRLLKLKEIIL